MHKNIKNLTGKRFGKLIVLKKTDMRDVGSVIWECLCDCGQKCFIVGYSLTKGATKSCGCLRRELSSSRNKKHGMWGTKTYGSWKGMIGRCHNINDKSYKDYGGRGISVCRRWRESFENFYKDMGEAPSKSSIDRINNGGNYCKENCRWATDIEQMNNTRRNRFLKLGGKTQTLSQWSRDVDIHIDTLWRRLKKGWTVKEALTIPLQNNDKKNI